MNQLISKTHGQVNYQVGDVVMASNNRAHGSVQKGWRPYVIVSNNVSNTASPIYNAIPFTTRKRKPQPTHCSFYRGEGGLLRNSILLAEQITTINKSDVANKVGHFNLDQMRRVAVAAVNQIPIVLLAMDHDAADANHFPKI